MGAFALIAVVVFYYFGSRRGKGLGVMSASAALNKEIEQNPLTYELSQYGVFADRLEVAFMGTDDEQAIYSVFSDMRNRSDVLQLIKSFGKRRQEYTIGKVGLSTWISYQLKNKEIAEINDILARNYIDFKF